MNTAGGMPFKSGLTVTKIAASRRFLLREKGHRIWARLAIHPRFETRARKRADAVKCAGFGISDTRAQPADGGFEAAEIASTERDGDVCCRGSITQGRATNGYKQNAVRPARHPSGQVIRPGRHRESCDRRRTAGPFGRAGGSASSRSPTKKSSPRPRRRWLRLARWYELQFRRWHLFSATALEPQVTIGEVARGR